MKKIFCLGLLALATATSSRADSALVFNEIMYHPPFHNNAIAEANHEWIELHNQLAVDLDVSDWRVTGDIHFTFPVGTRVPCLLYTSDAADERSSVDLGGRR